VSVQFFFQFRLLSYWVATMEKIDTPSDSERKPSYSDEKLDEKVNERVDVAQDFQGEIYDNIRAIDLDETGKERPIGKDRLPFLSVLTEIDPLVTDIDVATHLVSLEDDPTLPVFTF